MADALSRYRAPALDKGLDILELLAEHEAGLTQAEIANALGRSPSELYRMLDRLVRRGYVRRSNDDDRLVLGLKLFTLATRQPPMRRLLQLAGEVTTRVADETLQSCHLALYRDGNLFVAVQADSGDRLSLGVRLGAEIDLMSTGSGQVMLAFQSNDRRQRMLAAYAAATGATPRPSSVQALIEEVLAAGHVRKASAQAAGVVDLAYPILGRTGDAVAALAIPFIERLEPSTAPVERACLRTLSAAARALSADLPPGTLEHLRAIEDHAA